MEKKNWKNPDVDVVDVKETAQGANFGADDGSVWGDTGYPVGPCDPTDPS